MAERLIYLQMSRTKKEEFYFKLNKEPLDQTDIQAGLICEYLDDDLRSLYTLMDDKYINEYLTSQIEEAKAENPKTKIVDIVLLMSRPCDIAQDKFGKNLKSQGK